MSPGADPKPANAHWLDAWHVNPSVNRDYDFIDGLRGIAILMVIIGHLVYFNPQSGPAIRFLEATLSAGAYGGVRLFFALSGFLISWPFWKRKITRAEKSTPPGFAQRRFWKIYPPLALSILLLTPICVYRYSDWEYAFIGLKWLTGSPFLIPVSGKLNPVMWSLVVEAQFYIIIPLLFLALKRLSPNATLWIIGLSFSVIPFLYRWKTGLIPHFYPEINAHFPSGLDNFCLGILVAGLENQGLLRKTWARFGVLGAAFWPMTLVAFAWLNRHPEINNFALTEIVAALSKFAAALMLVFVVAPQHWLARAFCAPWLRWSGIISYEWYLFHQPIISWMRESFGPAGGNPFRYAAIVGGAFVLGLTLSAMIYRYFSLPILKYGREKRSGQISNDKGRLSREHPKATGVH